MATTIETQIQKYRDSVRRAERTLDRLEGERKSLMEQLKGMDIESEEELEEEISQAQEEAAELEERLTKAMDSFQDRYEWLEEV